MRALSNINYGFCCAPTAGEIRGIIDKPGATLAIQASAMSETNEAIIVNRNNCTALWLATSVTILFGGFDPSHAMQPCPPRAEMRENAQIIVEARVRSLFIGESGLLAKNDTFPTRMARAELEIKRVIKGAFPKKEVVAIGSMYPPGPYQELTLMAMSYGAGGDTDTFELELARVEPTDDFGFYPLNSCVYYKFPDNIEELTGWKDNPPRLPNVPLVNPPSSTP